MRSTCLVLAVAVVLAACQRRTDDAAGQPHAKGLLGDCDAVAESLASFALGNYAPIEQRAPEVDKQRQRCVTAAVTTAEAACLVKATDAWTAATCAPRLFPEVAPGGGDCAQVVARLRAAVIAQLGAVDPTAVATVDRMMPVMERACAEDGWPASLRACVLAVGPGDFAALERCTTAMPPELQDKLQRRLSQLLE